MPSTQPLRPCTPRRAAPRADRPPRTASRRSSAAIAWALAALTAAALSLALAGCSSGAETPAPPSGVAAPSLPITAASDAPAPEPADQAALVCWGDSLSFAICDAASGGVLQAHAPYRTIINQAISGQTSTQIALRMGAYPLEATFPGDVLPASGRTSVDIAGAPESLRGISTAARIGGIDGTLRFDGWLGGWTFERTDAGADTAIAPGTPVELRNAAARAHPGFVWVGRNNVNEPEQILADVAAMVAAHEAVSDAPLWVVGVTPASSETTGSAAAEAIAHINVTLRERYGERYLAIDEYLRDEAMGVLGLAATAGDRSAAESGVIPPSLMDRDGLHFNDAGNAAIAMFLAGAVSAG